MLAPLNYLAFATAPTSSPAFPCHESGPIVGSRRGTAFPKKNAEKSHTKTRDICFMYVYIYWLVVHLPFWKTMSQLGWLFPICGNKTVPNHQPVYIHMYIYIYMCVCVCMYVFMYVCIYVCMHVCMHACMYVWFLVLNKWWRICHEYKY